MTETPDPIAELAATLYDALYAITPYAEAHFADEGAGLENAVRAVLAEAAAQQWIQKQIDETGIRAMDFRNGAEMELAPARELLAHWVAAARAMLGDAPNYTETKVSMDVKVAESPEMYTLVVQRHAVGTLTPHEARQKAEKQRDEALGIVSGWVCESNDSGGIDADDLTWRLEQAGFPLPADVTAP